MPDLRLLPGGRSPRPVLLVNAAEHDGLHVELLTAQAERLVLTDKLRGYIRSAARLAEHHPAAARTYLDEMARLVEQEDVRARAMSIEACPDGREGSGHGRADEDALAVPARRAA